MDNFNEIWSRVSGSTPDEGEMLCHFIAREKSAADSWRSIAAGTNSAAASKVFCAMARDDDAHADRLQSEHLLLRGTLAATDSVKAPIKRSPSLLEALRQAYHRKISSARDYDKAAAEATDDYAPLLRGLAEDERHHSRELKRLINMYLTGERA